MCSEESEQHAQLQSAMPTDYDSILLRSPPHSLPVYLLTLAHRLPQRPFSKEHPTDTQDKEGQEVEEQILCQVHASQVATGHQDMASGSKTEETTAGIKETVEGPAEVQDHAAHHRPAIPQER